MEHFINTFLNSVSNHGNDPAVSDEVGSFSYEQLFDYGKTVSANLIAKGVKRGSSPELGEIIDGIDSAKGIVLDFAKIEYVSSAGIRQIVATHRKAKELEAAFSVINVNPEVMSVIAITGLDKKLNIKARQK